MRISVFDQWGALNSRSVWQAFRNGAARLGHTVIDHDMTADVAVIWSLVWAGRMRPNQEVWRAFRATNRPVIVLEVGTLRRGHTWKMGVNGLGSRAYWGDGLDHQRPQQLGIDCRHWQTTGQDLVILMQRGDSEQWAGQLPVQQWLDRTVRDLRRYSDRPIRIRRHPRQVVQVPAGCTLDTPLRQPNTYDNFDLDRSLVNAWAVINHNSGAGVSAALQGVPVFCDSSSLAAPVANLDWKQINGPTQPNRDLWLVELCHTEWTTDEIATGDPLKRLALAETI